METVNTTQAQTNPAPSVAVGPKEGAQMLGISEPTFTRLCRNGEIKAAKVGKQWRVGREWLMQYAGLE